MPAEKFFQPVADPANRCFLFSLHNAAGKPLKLALRRPAGQPNAGHGSPVSAVVSAAGASGSVPAAGAEGPSASASAGSSPGSGGGSVSSPPLAPASSSRPHTPPAPAASRGFFALYGHSAHGPVFGGSERHPPDLLFGVKDPNGARAQTLPFNHPQGNSANTPAAYYVVDERDEAAFAAGAGAGAPGLGGWSGPRPLRPHDRRLLAGGTFAR